uniref:ribosomal protein S7 n=1 Tax=Haramonas pauciplastida TaxID=478668 RepID=UPI002114823E|nr:ribosomal protein S7 [Haramonas pauciplastida]UTE94955.1 ribosomal protein S7 [Haramonas pauciplastida]
MSRKNISRKRLPMKDSQYQSYLISLFVARLLKKGKKRLAQKIVKGIFDIIEKKTSRRSFSIFEKAVKKVSPKVEVKAYRVGGSTYQVPNQVGQFRAVDLALKWIIKGSERRSGKYLVIRIADEIIDASRSTGNAIRKRDETHRMAKSNRTAAHLKY